jgi:hypothetical protein
VYDASLLLTIITGDLTSGYAAVVNSFLAHYITASGAVACVPPPPPPLSTVGALLSLQISSNEQCSMTKLGHSIAASRRVLMLVQQLRLR